MLTVSLCVFAVALTAIAAVIDWRTGQIPNALTLGGLGAGLLLHALDGAGRAGLGGAVSALGAALLATLVCGLAPYLVFALGGLGGGDVKLFAALGALCGTSHGMLAESLSFVVAVFILPGYLAYQGILLRTMARALSLLVNPVLPASRRRAVPPELMVWVRLGPAICAGTVLMLWLSPR